MIMGNSMGDLTECSRIIASISDRIVNRAEIFAVASWITGAWLSVYTSVLPLVSEVLVVMVMAMIVAVMMTGDAVLVGDLCLYIELYKTLSP